MNLQGLPSVEQLLQTRDAADLIASFGRPLTLQSIRRSLDDARTISKKNGKSKLPNQKVLLSQAASLLQAWTAPTLMPVINASGVILHTNLGRAPLSVSAAKSILDVARGYSNLEFDLETGKRGSRTTHAEAQLKKLTGGEAALVVNNNAAAVLLVMTALASKKEAVISRSQLVEIGGGFRIPDVMRQSGAKLIEVGTTNRVNLSDYEGVINEKTALVIHAHHSNFKMIGFTEEPNLAEIADLAHKSGVIFVDDLGSGTLLATERFGMSHEPTVQESIKAGADLVCFSGDKLLGGPQAGIIIGRAALIEKVKKHPLARAVRADKLCLTALIATLQHYLKDEAEIQIPVWQMISAPAKHLKTRAKAWAAELGHGKVLSSESTVGGGSLPGESLPTWVLSLTISGCDSFMRKLRMERPPIIARTENGRIIFDPRTVLPEQDGTLLAILARVITSDKGKRDL